MHKVRIYNLFPLLAGTLEQWDEWVNHAADLGFSWIYINSPFAAGASGNLFALADPFALDSRFLNPGETASGIFRLQEFLCRHRERGLRFMTDFNPLHMAADAPAVQNHPTWFVRGENGEILHPMGPDPLDADTLRVWEDLAETDFAHSPDAAGWQNYWESVLAFWVSLGFTGFRCLHATSMPLEFLRNCIRRALCTAREPVMFAADALGEPPEALCALRESGIHLVYNSSCWWQFDAPWAVEQHAFMQQFSPSISFPENHDTPRLSARSRSLLGVQKQRYVFASFFSAALQVTMGYEFCWQKACHSTRTTVRDQEDRTLDISGFIRECNRFSDSWPPMQEEGRITAGNSYWESVLFLEKNTVAGDGTLIVNKNWNHSQPVRLSGNGWMCRPFLETSAWRWEPLADELILEPAECVLIRRDDPPQQWRKI